jgi:hypothetical protein
MDSAQTAAYEQQFARHPRRFIGREEGYEQPGCRDMSSLVLSQQK